MPDYFTGYTNPMPQQTSLADMMNMASGVQQYQQAQQMNPLALQAKQLELQQAQQMNPLLLQKALAEANVATQTQEPRISQAKSSALGAKSQAETAELESQQKLVDTFTKMHSTAASNLLSIAQKPDLSYEDIMDNVKKTLSTLKASPDATNNSLAQIPDWLKSATPTQRQLWAAQEGTKSLSAQQRFESLYPPTQFLSTGGGIQPVMGGNPNVTGRPAGQTTGPGIPMTLPPNTPVIGANGVPTYLGAQNVQAALTPAQQAAGTGAGTAISEDVKQTQADASSVPQRKAVFQTMKSLIPTAYTGLAADKKLFTDKLLDLFGISHDTAAASSTEELAKNQNLLALVGGNTDSARQLAQIANPNVSMTKEGINKVINQLLSFEDFKESKANFLNGLQNNPVAYGQKLQQWNNVADPRFFQEMSTEEFNVFKKSPEYPVLMQKLEKAKQLGIVK
jgi:hypothetical protein